MVRVWWSGLDRRRVVRSAWTVLRAPACHSFCPLCNSDSITGEMIRVSKATAARYECERPGELIHMDTKKIGRIPDGWRVHGRANVERDRNTKVVGRLRARTG